MVVALCVFILWLKLFVATSWLLLCFPIMLCAMCLHLMVTNVYMLSSHCYCVCCHLMVTTVHIAISWLLYVAISWLLLCMLPSHGYCSVCVCCHHGYLCVCCPLIVTYVCVATSWLLLCVLPSHGYCCVCCHFMITAVCCQFMVTIVFVLQKWGGNCPQDHQECGEIPRGSQAGNQCP